jgi:transposase
VFWIVDNGSSHRGDRAAAELQARHPRIVIVHTPTYASWLNQVEIYFSIIQRKVLKPNDYTSLEELEDALHTFARRYSALDKPFAWCFTRQELERRLRDPNLSLNSTLSAAA